MLKVNSNFTRGGQTYQTPSVNVLDVLSEGVLCGSLDPDAEEVSLWSTDNCTRTTNH